MEMLNKKELKERLNDRKYDAMIDQLSIADFYKCMAQFSGLGMEGLDKNEMMNYLETWAINKYKFFKLLDNQLRVDFDLTYVDENRDYHSAFMELGEEFPAYYHWLYIFKGRNANKIDEYMLSWTEKETMQRLFHKSVEGMAITRFFKQMLNAPDELVTKIGQIYENQKIQAKYTISIDPVDMMLASENPYDWRSCYRLSTCNEESHADGCIAAVLDSSSLITYIWNKEGEFSLYDKYTFKSIRYKRMRQWISIHPQFKAVHFNMIYPGKSSYSNEFEKQLRVIVEDYIHQRQFPELENIWSNNEKNIFFCDRVNYYGYGEFNSSYIYYLKSACQEEIARKEESNTPWRPAENWNVYDEEYSCPCGCRSEMIPSDDQDNHRYNGEGFTYENFYEQYWCEYADDYCSCEPDEYNCQDCWSWRQAHPVCDLDRDEQCDNPNWRYTDDGVMESSYDHCEGCPLFKFHHPEYFRNEEDPDEARDRMLCEEGE